MLSHRKQRQGMLRRIIILGVLFGILFLVYDNFLPEQSMRRAPTPLPTPLPTMAIATSVFTPTTTFTPADTPTPLPFLVTSTAIP